jgi:hypothetical protein
MTLADIKASVRGLLTDDQYDEDLITEAANWFVYELFNNTRTRLMESSDTISAAINDTTADFPSDMMTWIGIYSTAPSVAEITERHIPYKQFMQRHAGFATATAARPDVSHGYDLIMYCPPGAATDIYVRIVNLHNDAVVLDTSYNTDIPAVNTGMCFKAELNNGAVAAGANLEIAKVYIETDY